MKLCNLPRYRLIYVKRFDFSDSESIVRIADPYNKQKKDILLNREESPLQMAIDFLEKRKISIDAISEDVGQMMVLLSLNHSIRII